MKEILIEWSPYASALIGGIFTLIAAVSSKGKKVWFAIVSIVLMFALIVITYNNWAPKGQWQLWAAQVQTEFADRSDQAKYYN